LIKGYVFIPIQILRYLLILLKKYKKDIKLGKQFKLLLTRLVLMHCCFLIKKIKWNCGALRQSSCSGIGEGEILYRFDASPFIEYTSNAVYLEDGEMAVISLHKAMKVRKKKNQRWFFGWSLWTSNEFGANWKGGYDHFMLKYTSNLV
jgi:glucosamine--fructose-6-phosphate aminotransferase (isomerizing)